MDNQNPLGLPEIRLLIVSYLEWRDIVSCLFVNRAWYHSFAPFTFEKTIVKYSHSEITRQYPSPDLVKLHCNYVRSLHLENIPATNYTISYPNLRSLYYLWDNTASSWTSLCDPAPFLKLNTRLVGLELTIYGGRASITSGCWKALSGLTHLKELALRYTAIPKINAGDFRKVCERLNTLRLICVTIPECAFLANTSFPQMRDMYLVDSTVSHRASLGSLVDMIQRCTRLKCLSCDPGTAREIVGRACPNLSKLTLRGTTRDDSLALMLRRMRQATSLDFKGIHFGSATVQELERHFHTLTDLNLKNCKAVTSNTVKAILCSCSQLQNLHADCIMATDAVSGEPWVCLSIMELDVFFEFTESERNLQPLIFERLSALVQLRNLSVGLICFQSGKQPTGGLDIRLSCGLKSLASLKQLESLNVSGTVQSIGEEDVNWMVANWRSLHKFLGTKNTMDETANKVIEGILKLHGVKKL